MLRADEKRDLFLAGCEFQAVKSVLARAALRASAAHLSPPEMNFDDDDDDLIAGLDEEALLGPIARDCAGLRWEKHAAM